MNSQSRTHCKDDCFKNHKEDDCCRKEKNTEVLLKCGNPTSVTIPDGATVGTTFQLSPITLNTGCFCNPCIKFEFASNIATAGITDVTINFQIFKQCRNQFGQTSVGPIWTFDKLAIVDTGSTETFSFIVCDCCSCPDDCCTYYVVATVNALSVGPVTINNATLSALVVENNCHCC